MSDMPKEVKRVIPDCQHDLSRMIEWCTNGACPICLTADAGTKKNELSRLREERNEWEQDARNWQFLKEQSERQLAGAVKALNEINNAYGKALNEINNTYGMSAPFYINIAKQALANLKEQSP